MQQPPAAPVPPATTPSPPPSPEPWTRRSGKRSAAATTHHDDLTQGELHPFAFQSLIKPPLHAPILPFGTAQTGITPADVADAPTAAPVLRRLDEALPERPVLLVAHHAPAEANLIYAYREACPRLANTRIVDTRLLAKHVVPDLTAYDLDALLAHHGIPQPPNRHRAMDDVTVTAALFRALLTEAARLHTISSVAELVRVASRTPRAALPTQLELP